MRPLNVCTFSWTVLHVSTHIRFDLDFSSVRMAASIWIAQNSHSTEQNKSYESDSCALAWLQPQPTKISIESRCECECECRVSVVFSLDLPISIYRTTHIYVPLVFVIVFVFVCTPRSFFKTFWRQLTFSEHCVLTNTNSFAYIWYICVYLGISGCINSVFWVIYPKIQKIQVPRNTLTPTMTAAKQIKKKLPNNTIANLTLYETKRCFNLSVPRQTIIALKQLARLLAELAPELRAQLLNGPI